MYQGKTPARIEREGYVAHVRMGWQEEREMLLGLFNSESISKRVHGNNKAVAVGEMKQTAEREAENGEAWRSGRHPLLAQALRNGPEENDDSGTYSFERWQRDQLEREE